MSSEEFKMLFSKKLNMHLQRCGLSKSEFAKKMNVGNSIVSDWTNGKKIPRMDKVDMMCNIFGCQRSDLIEDKEEHYYLDQETVKAAQELLENKDLALLFDAARDASAEDLKTVHTMLLALKNKEK